MESKIYTNIINFDLDIDNFDTNYDLFLTAGIDGFALFTSIVTYPLYILKIIVTKLTLFLLSLISITINYVMFLVDIATKITLSLPFIFIFFIIVVIYFLYNTIKMFISPIIKVITTIATHIIAPLFDVLNIMLTPIKTLVNIGKAILSGDISKVMEILFGGIANLGNMIWGFIKDKVLDLIDIF